MNVPLSDISLKPDQARLQMFASQTHYSWGAQYLTGENLKVAWAEFLTLS
jgi:hypothetical protein